MNELMNKRNDELMNEWMNEWMNELIKEENINEQCLGSGSARFWLPGSGSGSAKICGSTDPDPRDQLKTAKKTFLLLKPKSELLKEKRDYKISSFLNGS